MNAVRFTTVNNIADEAEIHQQGCSNLRDFLSTSDAQYFQLNSYTDLHRLLSAQYIKDGILLPKNSFSPQIYTLATNTKHTNYCSYFKLQSLPPPIEDSFFGWSTKSITTKEKRLIEQLFHVYLSTCCIDSIHPDHERFLESYYCCELDPALVHTAVARAAIHLLLKHPEAPLRSKLRAAVGSLLAQAKRSLAEVFDVPTPQVVLAFINMDACLQELSRYKEAYAFYSQAVRMAFALQMDRDDSTEKDSVQLEFRKRIWADVCMRELFYVFDCAKPSLVNMNIIKSSPKPTVTTRDSESYKFALICLLLQISTFSRLLELQNIDWSLPDVMIVQKLAGLAAHLQNEQTEYIPYCGEDDRQKFFLPILNYDFWSQWCALWRQFIKSDAPTGRLETNLMQQLREKAFDEYVKVF
ncbi:uncharacterized protein VTP21DRAFT_6897 [Calcarisporiella thermophila]|uniref:uncharacterized protein n=1 Tax=Calcarisporiella thermophila TaxID=911321 RepID=UPI0037423071